MLLDTYQEKVWLVNANVKGKEGKFEVYRGDLVLEEGEVADAMGRRLPPHVISKEAVLLSDGEKLKFVAGFVDELAQLKLFPNLYGADLAEDVLGVFFVANLAEPLQATLEGVKYVLIPLQRGMIWNELIEELRMEKSDFKGQGAEEKVVTLYEAFKDYKPKYPSVSFEEALTKTVNEKREVWGAV
ncbi:hypothetical protein [Methylomagnum sp.]